jgi:uncharacterized protein YhjY with autotransporter beta-barrel domain
MLKQHSVFRVQVFMVYIFSCVSSAMALAASEVSIDGADFQSIVPPITIIQETASNSVSIVEEQVLSDSAVLQTGSYNRTAIIQYGNDKLVVLRQPGLFNRALIVQVASTDQDLQTIDSRQGEGLGSTNYLFTLQTSIDDSNPIARQFGGLTFDQAKTVAKNFIFAPELSRVNVGLLEDISLHFTSLLENRLDQDRFGSCADRQVSLPGADDGDNPIKRDPACSSEPFFATLSYGRADRDSSLGLLGYEQNIRSATLGADFRINPTSRFGIAFNFAESSSDLYEGLGSVDTTGYQIGGFGSISQSQYYLDLIATLGKVDFSSDRFGGASEVGSDTDGWGYTGRLQGGYFFDNDNLRFGPFITAVYSKGRVEGYWEEGSVLLTQRIEEQKRERFVASLGAAFDRQDTIGGYPVRSYLKLELERDFGIGREDTVESRFAFSPDLVVTTPLDDVIEETYGRISGGLSLVINRQARLSLAGMTLVGADRLDTYDIYGELSVAF